MKRNKFFTLVPAIGVAFALLYTLSASPGHGYVSVAAGGFSPQSDNCDYSSVGSSVTTDAGSCYFYAPVQLPQGATVTKLIASWTDYSPSYEGTLFLYRVSTQTGTAYTVAAVSTQGSNGTQETSETTTIYNNPIDNSQYAYYVEWFLYPGVNGKNVIIEYTYPTGLPLVLRNFQEPVRGR